MEEYQLWFLSKRKQDPLYNYNKRRKEMLNLLLKGEKL